MKKCISDLKAPMEQGDELLREAHFGETFLARHADPRGGWPNDQGAAQWFRASVCSDGRLRRNGVEESCRIYFMDLHGASR